MAIGALPIFQEWLVADRNASVPAAAASGDDGDGNGGDNFTQGQKTECVE